MKPTLCSALLVSLILSVTAHAAAASRTVVQYMTAFKTDSRLSPSPAKAFSPKAQPREDEHTVFIDPDKTFQTILGLGGALTDAAAETFAKLPKDKQQQLLQAYFDKDKGIGYTLARTHIHSCDFSSASYTYMAEGDKDLKTFSVEPDRRARIPFIKQAIAAAGGKLTLYASPWSPPAFMKDTGQMLQGGKLKPEYYSSWANYYAKFIKAYEAEGIPVWGVSIQNEPMAKQKWESCIYTAEEERDFLKNHLGPTLKKEGLQSRKIIGWDHNRDLLYQRAEVMLSDPEAKKYLWGLGFHWYEGWPNSPTFDNVRITADAFPDINLLFTEGTTDRFDRKRMKDWSLGERYGLNMIRDFNSGSVGFTDWNILLDERGGPNHVGNFCFAPVHGNTKTGELTFTNSYYYIGHFSKFIRPGAKRILASSSRAQLLTTAFKNTDGSIAVIVMNTSEKAYPYSLYIKGQAADFNSPPRSIQTLVF